MDINSQRDEFHRRYTDIVAIDAIHFYQFKTQFEEAQINRELKKSYAGFLPQVKGDAFPVIATGNWGCGAFRGDRQLKCKYFFHKYTYSFFLVYILLF